jgi:hypothetical protein
MAVPGDQVDATVHHPDKRLAKAARKSAFLAASRPKPSR